MMALLFLDAPTAPGRSGQPSSTRDLPLAATSKCMPQVTAAVPVSSLLHCPRPGTVTKTAARSLAADMASHDVA